MFILYAIPIGLAAGILLGGRLEGLALVGFRWGGLAIAGLAVQLAIFGPLADRVGDLGPPLYVASTLAVLGAVIRNIRITGMALVAVGAACNLVAILANGGRMPADPGALAAAGLARDGGFSNSVASADPALRPLTDVFALPAGVPLANVFSVGDVLIGLGIAVVIAILMRGQPTPLRPDNSYH
jgi:hypothetical protein